MKENVIAVIGLGYVGMPLAVHFARHYRTIGFDINEKTIEYYRRGEDPTGEVSDDDFKQAKYLELTTNRNDLKDADFIVVAVPTPIDEAHQPDLTPVEKASVTAGQVIKKGAVVIFESTVYPGVTEEVCVPILERESGLSWKKDFHVGYSPERINPGDKEHTLPKIVKVVSGDDEKTLDLVAKLYETVITAGVHRAESIKVAEAAKVIENTQRDLNIALINELAIIFDKLDIDTLSVLEAAGTKWNFLNFRPGLVGGHCIGVDPYYLTYKAGIEGYHPEVILAGRRINDGMGKYVAEKTVKKMIQAGTNIKGATVGILGLTFKEDCPDLRNTRVTDIIEELESYGVNVLVHDPIADAEEAKEHYGITVSKWDSIKNLSGLIIAVPHEEYRHKEIQSFVSLLTNKNCPIIDVKSMINKQEAERTGISFWRL